MDLHKQQPAPKVSNRRSLDLEPAPRALSGPRTLSQLLQEAVAVNVSVSRLPVSSTGGGAGPPVERHADPWHGMHAAASSGMQGLDKLSYRSHGSHTSQHLEPVLESPLTSAAGADGSWQLGPGISEGDASGFWGRVFGRKSAAAQQTPSGQQGVQQQGTRESKGQQQAAADPAAEESAGGRKEASELTACRAACMPSRSQFEILQLQTSLCLLLSAHAC